MDDMIRWTCPGCDKRLKAPAASAGNPVACSRCRCRLRVPDGDQPIDGRPRAGDLPPRRGPSLPPPPVAPATREVAEWHTDQAGKSDGPVTFRQLRQAADSGALRPIDLVWKEGMADWVPVWSVPELGRPNPGDTLLWQGSCNRPHRVTTAALWFAVSLAFLVLPLSDRHIKVVSRLTGDVMPGWLLFANCAVAAVGLVWALATSFGHAVTITTRQTRYWRPTPPVDIRHEDLGPIDVTGPDAAGGPAGADPVKSVTIQTTRPGGRSIHIADTTEADRIKALLDRLKKGAAVRAQLAALADTWELAARVADGQLAPPAARTLLTLDGGRYTVRVGGAVAEAGTVRVYPLVTPRALDFVPPAGDDRPCRFDLAGDELKVAYLPGSRERPSGFECPPDTGGVIETWRRMRD